MLFNPARRCCLLWRSLAAWRAWKSGPSSCHSSSVSVHSGPGSLDGSTQLSSVSAENPPHTPVMLKEVLHYLDIQQGQVCNHVCQRRLLFFFFNVLFKKCQGLWSLYRLSKSFCFGYNPWGLLGAPCEHNQRCLHTSPRNFSAPRFKTIFNSTRRSTSRLCVPQCYPQGYFYTAYLQDPDSLTSCIDSLLFVVSCVFSTELLLTQAINKHLENWTVFRLSASLICCRK